jgi:hypothetical protein
MAKSLRRELPRPEHFPHGLRLEPLTATTGSPKISGIGNIQSSVALKQVKYKTTLPLPSERTPNRRQRSRQ